MNDDEILEYNSEDLHNPVYAKPRTRPIISSSELVGRDNERVANNLKNMGTVAYGVARVLPATRFATDIIDFGQGLIDDEVDAGAPAYAIGKTAEEISKLRAYGHFDKPSGNWLKDKVGYYLYDNFVKNQRSKDGKMFRRGAAAERAINNKINKGANIVGEMGRKLSAFDMMNDSYKLGDYLYQWGRYGDIDEKRNRLHEDMSDAVKEKVDKAAETLKNINWRK
jgi:hypothetical protein